MTENLESKSATPKIIIMPNGSYHVFGEVPLVHKTQVVSEYGEPLTWKKDNAYEIKKKEGREFYRLCRCGQSKNKPFCDGMHVEIEFDGTETADTFPTKTRSLRIPHGTRIIVMRDSWLCMQSGFCGLRDATLSQLVATTDDTKVRSLVMAMVERCPSGALTYRIERDGSDIEPDLPVQIAVTTEITSEGPIEGPLWVTGNIPIERSDGKPIEIRNRVTLCNCGQSRQKPLCDGIHRKMEERDLKMKKSQEE
jgi:CDGSH-type Zn-finger protein